MCSSSITVHVCAVAYRPIDRDSSCLVRALCDLLARYAGAIRVYVYAVEGSHVASAEEVVSCVRRSTVRRAYHDAGSVDDWSEAYEEYTRNAYREIVRRATRDDYVIAMDGTHHRPLCDRLRSADLRPIVLEFYYAGPRHDGGGWAPCVAWPSSSRAHRLPSPDPRRRLDVTLPFPVTIVDPPPPSPSRGAREKYAVYVVAPRDGLEKLREVIDVVVSHAGYALCVLGGARPPSQQEHANVRWLGAAVSTAQRRRWIRDAFAVLVMSSPEFEAFDYVPCESMALGTPVVSFGPHPAVEALLTFEGYPLEWARGETHRDARARALREADRRVSSSTTFRDACRRRALSFCSANVVGTRLLPWMVRAREEHLAIPSRKSVASERIGRVYCVNLLERRPDRRARMRHVFEKEGFDPDTDVTFVDADVPDRARACPWTDAEVFGNARSKHATFLSHLRTWRRALVDWTNHDASHVLICEDDLIFAKDWRERIDGLLRDAPRTRLVMLNACARDQDRWIPDRFVRADGCMLTGCYMVSRSLLTQLLDTYSETRPEIADMCLYHVQRTLEDGEGWVFHPMLACQILDSSDIQTPDHQATIVRWTREHMRRWGDRYTLI